MLKHQGRAGGADTNVCDDDGKESGAFKNYRQGNRRESKRRNGPNAGRHGSNEKIRIRTQKINIRSNLENQFFGYFTKLNYFSALG